MAVERADDVPRASKGRLAVLIAGLRSGRWLTPARQLAYPRIIGAALALATLLLVATSHRGVDLAGRPLGTDFVGVWVAGGEVLAGHPAMPYDNAAHAAAQAMAFGPSDSFLPWPYPPVFLLVAAALAVLPYLWALAVWQAGTLLLYMGACRSCLAAGPGRRDALVAALAYPAVTINLLHGQNGFLSAGLLAFGSLWVLQRPVLAGLLFGCLIFKPQLALAVPIALIAGRHWRAFAAAAASAASLCGLSVLAFGQGPWRAFVENLGFARRVILEMGGLETYKLQSAFAAARLLGASVSIAYAVQIAMAAAALAAVAWVWRATCDARLRLAVLAPAGLLATPYAMDYDMVILGPALVSLFAVVKARGAPPWAISLMALSWVAPLIARLTARVAGLPLGLLSMVALIAIVVVVARRSGSDLVRSA